MVVCGDWRGAVGEESGEERCGVQPIATVRGIKAGGIGTGTDCRGEGEVGGHDMRMRLHECDSAERWVWSERRSCLDSGVGDASQTMCARDPNDVSASKK